MEGANGRPLGVGSLVLDISHSRARERLAVLRQASIRIGSTLDVMRTAQELADLAVPVLAGYVTVDLAESVLPEEEPLQRLAATHRRPGRPAQAVIQWDCLDSDSQRWEISDTGYIQNVRTGKYMAIGASSTENGAHAIQWEHTGSTGQRWV